MKIYILTFILSILLYKPIVAQEFASVEKSIWQVQSLLVTKYFSNESRLKNNLALRKEIGFSFSYADGFFLEKPIFTWVPYIRIEPRYYYNLEKRLAKGKKIAQNSGNFVTLSTTFQPDWFVISTEPNMGTIPHLSLIPTWGIRRSPTRHFNYEAGIGVGYGVEFYKYMTGTEAYQGIFGNLHLRFGFQL